MLMAGDTTDWLTTNRMNRDPLLGQARVVPKVEAVACIGSAVSGSAVRMSAESPCFWCG
jgi:hypothetical protein